jgi:predicted regulator of Ras-like GTPase activity (Roadblock/LC7/MglB family)
MNLSGEAAKRLLLYSLILLVVPLILYPEKLGTFLQDYSSTNIVLELLFYLLLTFVLYRQGNAMQMVAIVFIGLGYRLLISSIFSVLLSAFYNISSGVAFSLGMYGYLPSLLFQVFATQFIIKNVMDDIFFSRPRIRRPRPSDITTADSVETGTSTFVVTKEKNATRPDSPPPRPAQNQTSLENRSAAAESPVVGGDAQGFDKATRYIGEHSSVKLAAVVDHEGLLLSNFTRGGIIAEDVAPFALLIKANGAGSMNFLSYGCPERVEFQLSNDRVVLCYEESYCLMVIAERHNDDLLNIRINQAMEMVKKYMSERYSEMLRPAMEKSYA